jgi:RNA polymerase sigma-70 factor, ECF subfamily
VLLIDAEGLSYTEVAEVLNLPAGTVASRLNRARSFLQAALKGVES